MVRPRSRPRHAPSSLVTLAPTQHDFRPMLPAYEATMTTVTIEVASLETTAARMKSAFRGEPQGCYISFPSHEELWSTMTANR